MTQQGDDDWTDAGLDPSQFDEPDLSEEGAVSEGTEGFEEPEGLEAEEEALARAVEPPQQLLQAREEAESRLLTGVAEQALAAESGTEAYGFENIVGVGVGEKVTGGRLTGEMAVTVYVVAKASPGQLADEAQVPDEINGMPTDVVAIGELWALPHRGRYRPAPSGVSVGHFRITAGTLGCLARRGSQLFILSNNHVLANENAAAAGDPILQPGPLDGGRRPGDVIARLTQFVPLRFGGPVNHVDAAIAQTSPRLVTPRNLCLGRISATPVACRRGMVVRKCGRTTQHTRGIITDCNATVRVNYRSGVALFQNQVLVRAVGGGAFSQGGDSGSLIVQEAVNRPVALLFAGSTQVTIANPIGRVLGALNVQIVA